MKYARNFFVIVALAICMGCSDNSTDKKNKECAIPLPEAIFKKDVAGISNHKFERTGRDSEEYIEFTDSTAVTIYQSGCDKITQEFRFRLKPSSKKVLKPTLAIDRLAYLSQLGPDYMTFGGWAKAIDDLQEEFAQNNTVQVEPGFYVSLDKLDSKDRSTLIIKLFQK